MITKDVQAHAEAGTTAKVWRFVGFLIALLCGNSAWAITATLTAPSNGAVFAAPATIALAATATPTNQNRPIVKVEFFRGTTLIGTDTTAPYTFTWSNVTVGSYTLTAKATDSQGATATSSAVTITVNAPPTVSLTAPANNAVFTTPANITLTATAADSDGTVSKVEFFRDTTLIGTDTTSPYSFAWNNVPAGSYSLTAKATDNRGAVNASTAVNIVVGTAPTVAITSPTSGASFTAPATITIAATASDADGTVAKVDFYQGATLLGTATTAPYSFIWSNLPAGNYSLTAKATDNVGMVSTSAAIAVSVQANAAPTVNLTSPANNTSYNAPATITLMAQAQDTDGTIAKVEFFAGATPIVALTSPPYTFNWAGVTPGTYSITSRATDNAGATANSNAASVTVAAAAKQVYFIDTDHLNTPRLISNSTGMTVWRWDNQEPFGNTPPDQNPSGIGNFDFPLRFAGQYADPETGLNYNYFRDYDPQIGRYVQSDPIGLFGGINTYAYGDNNPLSKLDRFGLNSLDPSRSSPSRPSFPGPFDVFFPGTPSNDAFIRSVGQIVKAIKDICRPDDDRERCREVLKNCRKGCLDTFVNNPNGLPGTGSDLAGRQRLCIRECMERNGCYDF
jgi:RHS repeat-associated protein